MIRSDRGGEFTSQQFSSFCEDHGIKRQLTTPYSPQQNGVCERKNRTVLGLVRSVLKRSGMPRTFWPEAAAWCIHVMNRSPTSAVERTPEELWNGKVPAVHYFRVFGCIAYSLIPEQRRTKLDDKALKCVLLGVSEESKAYKLYNPISKKIIISRDVFFKETEFWPWNSPQEQHRESIAVIDDDDDDEETVFETPVTSNTSQHSTQDQSGGETSSRPQRQRRTPVWMEDMMLQDCLILKLSHSWPFLQIVIQLIMKVL